MEAKWFTEDINTVNYALQVESQAHYGTFERQVGTRWVKRIIERKWSCDILNGLAVLKFTVT